jgi:uncharacterized protein (DUF433 family)
MWRRGGWVGRRGGDFTTTLVSALPAFDLGVRDVGKSASRSAALYAAEGDQLGTNDAKQFWRGGILSSLETAMSSTDSIVVRNPNILSGTPVFRGTRVPLQLLFDSLERGHTLEQFLEGYPTVSREMAIAALQEAQQLLSAKA